MMYIVMLYQNYFLVKDNINADVIKEIEDLIVKAFPDAIVKIDDLRRWRSLRSSHSYQRVYWKNES